MRHQYFYSYEAPAFRGNCLYETSSIIDSIEKVKKIEATHLKTYGEDVVVTNFIFLRTFEEEKNEP